jgi:hypothetical protein
MARERRRIAREANLRARRVEWARHLHVVYTNRAAEYAMLLEKLGAS